MADFNDMKDTVSGVDTVKKNKGKLIAGVTAGALVVVAGGGFAAYAASDYVKNQVKLAVSSPENYYTWVNEKNSSDFAEQISEQYRKAIDEMKNGQTASVSLTYEPSDSVKDELSSGEDESVIEVIRNINNISLGVNASSKDSFTSGNIFADINGERMATFDVATDASTMDVFFRVAELSEQWINLEMEDAGSLFYMNGDEAATAYEKFASDPESIITPEELETEILKYTDIWNECIAEVELEKKADVDINGITVNYTVVTVEITEEKAREITEKFVNAAKEDEILRSIVVDRLGIADSAEYDEDLDSILEDMEQDTDISTDTVILNTYIDPTGCIRGVSFEGTGDIDESMRFIAGKDGDDIRGEFIIKDGTDDDVKFLLTATDNDGKYTGSLDMIVYEGEKISVEFSELETVNEEKGYMNGVITLVFDLEDEEIPPVSFDLTSDGSAQTISLPLNFDGTDYGRISLTMSAENGAEPVIPDKSGAFVISEDSDIELSDYIAQDKAEAFFKEMLIKIGFSEEDSAEAAAAIAEEMYYDYSSDYYDDWDDDYSNGWDTTDVDWDTSIEDIEVSTTDVIIDDADPYENDMIIPENGQAYLAVSDYEFNSMYMTGWVDNLGYNATLADITGDGTYTVKLTADTDGYKNAMGDDVKPEGIAMLAVEVDGLKGTENASINVTSIKIDGKEVEITDAPASEYDKDLESLYSFLYYAFGDEVDENIKNAFDGSTVGEWIEIEVTFEIKGME